MIAALLVALFALQSPSKPVQPDGDPTAKALKSMTLDLAKLGEAATRTYDFVLLGEKAEGAKLTGTLVVSTRTEGDRILLSDTWSMVSGGKTRNLTLTQTCARDNFLTPLRLGVVGDGDEGPIKLDAHVVAADPAAVRPGILREVAKDEYALPAETLTSLAWLRIITLLPREKGARVTYPFSLESDELHLKKDHTIECVGAEDLKLGDRRVRCTKYTDQGGGNTGSDLWVDETGVLQRVLIDGRKQWTLRSEAAAVGGASDSKDKAPPKK